MVRPIPIRYFKKEQIISELQPTLCEIANIEYSAICQPFYKITLAYPLCVFNIQIDKRYAQRLALPNILELFLSSIPMRY